MVKLKWRNNILVVEVELSIDIDGQLLELQEQPKEIIFLLVEVIR